MNKLGHEKVAKATRKSKLPCGVSKHLVARPISGATPRSNTHTQPLQNRSPKNRLAPPMGTTTTSHLYNTTILRGRLSNSLSLSPLPHTRVISPKATERRIIMEIEEERERRWKNPISHSINRSLSRAPSLFPAIFGRSRRTLPGNHKRTGLFPSPAPRGK